MTSEIRLELRRETWAIFRLAVITVGAMALIGAALQVAFMATFYLRSVEIPDHTAMEDPVITVDRRISRTFNGSFSLVIRDAESHIIACIVPWYGPFTYRRDAYISTPVLKRKLSYWLGGKNQLARCRAEGFLAGEFTVSTCHRMHVGPVPVTKRCVASNAFRVD